MSNKRKYGGGNFLPLKKVRKSIDNLFGPIRTKAPPHVRKVISELGKEKIVGLQVGRNPLDKPLQKFLNFISRGKYEKKRKELGYDDVYHTYLIALLEDGRRMLIEKNSEVRIVPYEQYSGEQLKNVPMVAPVELETFLENGQKYFNMHPEKMARPQNYWQYDAATNNCQYFVNDLITGNTPYIRHPNQVKEFTQQDIVPIMESLPLFARKTLDFKQHLDHFYHGDGLKKMGGCLHPNPHLIKGQGFWGDAWKIAVQIWNYFFGDKPQYMSEHRREDLTVQPWQDPKDLKHYSNPDDNPAYSYARAEKTEAHNPYRAPEVFPKKKENYKSKYPEGTFLNQIDSLEEGDGLRRYRLNYHRRRC